MNKVILMGRLVRDPEVRYSQGAEPLAVADTLGGQPPFQTSRRAGCRLHPVQLLRKAGEFAGKILQKGQMVSIIGRLQVRSWDDNEGKKRWSTDVVVEEQYFAESKAPLKATKMQHRLQPHPRPSRLPLPMASIPLMKASKMMISPSKI